MSISSLAILPVPVVQNPGANPPGLDGEPESVRAAYDALAVSGSGGDTRG